MMPTWLHNLTCLAVAGAGFALALIIALGGPHG
jgi:hypothetical protein